jgi:hypothetical protein
MNAAEWVREKNPAAPRDLRRAMAAAVESATGTNLTSQLTSASRTLARQIAAQGCTSRDGAIHLLTLDALITGAMESGATNAAACEAAASSLLSVISEAAAIE